MPIVRTSHVKCFSSSILAAIERKLRRSALFFFRKVRTRTVGLGRTGVVFEFDSLSVRWSSEITQALKLTSSLRYPTDGLEQRLNPGSVYNVETYMLSSCIG